MAHRTILTARQRVALFDLPTDEATRLTHYILDDDDIDYIQTWRHPRNRMGFAPTRMTRLSRRTTYVGLRPILHSSGTDPKALVQCLVAVAVSAAVLSPPVLVTWCWMPCRG